MTASADPMQAMSCNRAPRSSSLRIPPTLDIERTRALNAARGGPSAPGDGRFEADQGATGWDAPATAPWRTALSPLRAHYGKPAAAMGEGGTIPFMAMLGKHFPDAQFLITGVLGPKSNAHGPNEFLHIPYATKLTACVAMVLAAHAAGRGTAQS
jgi:acetylornithine deacetylase/succinyl-diaminopimelate desuccinylase-like protein